jgi:predicted porin
MHKQIIRVAVAAALATPLAAQADIRLSGAIQAEIGSVEAGTDSERTTVTTDNTGTISAGGGPNKVSFDVDEDLGGGLSAFARADWGYNTTTSANNGTNITDREKYLGLQSSSGAYFKIGRTQGVYKTAHKIDPFYGTGAQMRCGGGESCGGDHKAFTHSSMLNNIVELGFKNNGFKVGVQTIVDEPSGQDGSYLLDVEYGNESFNAFGAYSNASIENGDDKANWKIGGDYTMGGFTLGLMYEDAEMGAEYMDAEKRASAEGQFITISGKYAISNVILGAWVGSFLEGADTDDISDQGQRVVENFGDSISYSLGAIYAFSPKTIVYAAYHSTDSDSKDSAGNEDGADWDAFAAGIRHSF